MDWGALHVAAYAGQLSMCRYLTQELQCNPFEKDEVHCTFLFIIMTCFLFCFVC